MVASRPRTAVPAAFQRRRLRLDGTRKDRTVRTARHARFTDQRTTPQDSHLDVQPQQLCAQDLNDVSIEKMHNHLVLFCASDEHADTVSQSPKQNFKRGSILVFRSIACP